MNKIEQKFTDAICEFYGTGKLEDFDFEAEGFKIQSQAVIDIYKVDFLIDIEEPTDKPRDPKRRDLPPIQRLVVEIDGHDAHKTKEQRFGDYQRERYLLRNNCFVIRFMGTEIYLNATKCVEETICFIDMIRDNYEDLKLNSFEAGLQCGRDGR